MLIAKKIRLLPTPEQEALFWQSAGAARWTYNFGISRIKEVRETLNETLLVSEIRKEITQLKTTEEYAWLKDVSSNVPKQVLKELNTAFSRMKNGSGYPKYKTRHGSRISFYVNYESLTKTDKGFKGERLGEVITSEPLPTLPEGENTHDQPYPLMVNIGIYP